jgi:hypothetical protein
LHASDGLGLCAADGLLDSYANLGKGLGLFDALPHDPQIPGRWSAMHGEPDQDGGSWKRVNQALADLLQNFMPSLVEPNPPPQVDAQSFEVGTRIPVDLHDIGCHGISLRAI